MRYADPPRWQAWCCLLLLLLGLATLSPRAHGASADASLPLNDATRAWLASHAVWRVGVAPDWMPVDQFDARGTYTGLSADVMHDMAQRLGVTIRVQGFASHRQALGAATRGEVEVLVSATRAADGEPALLFTGPYAKLGTAFLARQDAVGFSSSLDVAGRTIAVERGSHAEGVLKMRFPEANRLAVQDTLAALRAVEAGTADLYRGALLPAHYLAEREGMASLAVVGGDASDPGELRFASVYPQVISALNAALAGAGEPTLRRLADRWRPAYVNLMPRGAAMLPAALAASEQGEIKVAYDAGFSPLSRQEADGTAGGLGVDIFRLSAEAVGLQYRLIAKPSFSDALQSLRLGEVDAVVAAVRTPEREAFARFVGPYYKSPTAIVSRIGDVWVSLTSLSGQRLAIDGNHYLIDHIRRTVPGIHLVTQPDIGSVMTAVAQGKAEAALANLEYAAAAIPERFAGLLQVSGVIEEAQSELSFMVRRDRNDVASALAAGLDAVPPRELRAAANAQLRTKVPVRTDWQSVALVAVPVVSVLLSLLLASLLYARRLRTIQQALKEQRDAAARLAQARTDFLADVSHDVRTPLVALASGIRLLRDKLMPGEDADVLAGRLAGSAESLVNLLNRLLDVSRLEAGRLALHREPGSVTELVQDAVEHFLPSAQAKGLVITTAFDTALPLLLLDVPRTMQVVNNLIGNAIKFTEHGHVHVELRARPLRAHWWRLKLIVTDSGPGMDAATQKKLFERFSQGTQMPRQGGHGLGMSIVSDLVRLAEGRVRVVSTVGQGTRIEVAVLVEQVAGDAPAPLPTAATTKVFPSLFMVEDDEATRLVLAHSLRRHGIAVFEAGNAATAFEEYVTQQCAMFVTDADLGPGGSGAELAMRVKKVFGGKVTTVVLSGSAVPPSLPPGVDAWITKPQSLDDHGWIHRIAALRAQVAAAK